MGFLDRPKQKSSNPATKFLEWKSEEKKFSYYDKEAKKNVFVDLPLTFLVLEEYHTIKGFSDSDQIGIYSNEVLQTSTDELEVKTFKGRIIAKGLYDHIKSIVKDAGGRYYKSIYVVTKEGELINISFKGTAVASWSEFTSKGAYKRLKDEWVTVVEAKDKKKGRIDYSIPIFKFDSSLTDKEFEMVSKQAEIFNEYITGYLAKPTVKAEDAEVNEPETVSDGDELDF